MCTASLATRIKGERAAFNGQDSEIFNRSPAQNDSRRDVTAMSVSKVFEAVQKTFQYVLGAADSTQATKKRKITEDRNGQSTAKKPKTSLEECVNQNDIDRDNDCSICLAPWSNSGAHRLTSLRCGHLFGHSCIVRWIEHAHSCPYCCSYAEISDLRNIYAQKIKVEDTTERDLAVELLMKERAARRELKWQLAKQKADNEALRLEINQLREQCSGSRGQARTTACCSQKRDISFIVKQNTERSHS